MTTRTAALLVAAVTTLVLAGCGKAAMSSDEATRVAVDAFRSAGLDAEVGEVVEDATVDRAIDGRFVQVHQVELVIDDLAYLAGVSRTEGAVVRLNEPADTGITEAQLSAIAAYRSNPAEDAARRTQAIAWLVVIVAAVAAAYTFFRVERRKAESATADADEIPLT